MQSEDASPRRSVPLIWYSAETAAEALDMHRLGFKAPARTLKRWAREGKIPHGTFGRRVVFFPEDLLRVAAETRDRSRRRVAPR